MLKPMTRINAGFPVKELTRQHLLSEAREMKRIPNTVVSGRAVIKDIPEHFTLGKGHVKFFYNKLGYLLRRYKEVHAECLARGYNVTDYSSAWDNVPQELMGEWTPTEKDAEIIRERIKSKLLRIKS